jgi:hypothetical protein
MIDQPHGKVRSYKNKIKVADEIDYIIYWSPCSSSSSEQNVN